MYAPDRRLAEEARRQNMPGGPVRSHPRFAPSNSHLRGSQLTDAATRLTALAERIELWPVERLRTYERNPRTHSEDQVAQLAASMVEFGFTNPILVDESNGILAGHGRLLAARQLGLIEGPGGRLGRLCGGQERAVVIAHQ